ncbi:hypothetical protein T484DRAFT_1766925 [Baffinella frigidus]|nr:hypothetical protein T484DRAFT_1766925 [Cryptophyta sp. CCMP2293]
MAPVRILWCLALLAHVLCLDGSSVQCQRDRPARARHNAKGQSDTDEEGSGLEWSHQGGAREQRVCAHRQCRQLGQFADVLELKMAAVTAQPVQYFCHVHKKPGQMLPNQAMRTCQRGLEWPTSNK